MERRIWAKVGSTDYRLRSRCGWSLKPDDTPASLPYIPWHLIVLCAPAPRLLSAERHERNMPGPLHSPCQGPLMRRAVPRCSSRQYLAAVRYVPSQLRCILVVNTLYLVYTESADFSPRSLESCTSNSLLHMPSGLLVDYQCRGRCSGETRLDQSSDLP